MWKNLFVSACLVAAAACHHKNDPTNRPPGEPLPMPNIPEAHAGMGDDAMQQSTDTTDTTGGTPMASDAGAGSAATHDGGTPAGDGGTSTGDAGTKRHR